MTTSRTTGANCLPGLRTWDHIFHWSDVYNQDVVLGMAHRFAERGLELEHPDAGQATLEHGELHPGTVALHDPEYAAPSLRLGNVIADDI